MLAAERISRIVTLLNEQGSVKVEDLARLFQVSEMTIRRDLEKCRRAGTVCRCHGGAVLKNEIVSEASYDDKLHSHKDEKLRLAAYCASLVEPGSTVYLDAGTTTFAIAQALRHVPDLTVVTGDLGIALSLSQASVKTVILGGAVQPSTGSVLGETASRTLESMRLQVAFLGSASINDDWEVLTPTVEKAFMKRLAATRANESYLVVDSSKFHRQALYQVNSLADYTAVITTNLFSPGEQRAIREQGINMVIVRTEEL